MSARPYFDNRIFELENLAERGQWNNGLLKLLREELKHRSTNRAEKLKNYVDQCLRRLHAAKAAPRVHSSRRALLDRSSLVELNDIVEFASGLRLQIRSANVAADPTARSYYAHDEIGRIVLDHMVGDTVALLNGTKARIVAVEKWQKPAS